MYVVRLLLRLVSEYVHYRDGLIDCYFEHRSNLSHDEVRSNVNSVALDPEDKCKQVFGEIMPRSKAQRKNLQVDDSCVGSVWNALVPDRYGNIEKSYFNQLKEQLWRGERDQSAYGNGLVLMPEADKVLEKVEAKWLKGM